ncbi:hypothetical protein [Streptococcus respiraculi]|uniref:hypothetical protein n=1 Tax=Streptococcus respiraculi TaxID=2021971 RepID=UPI000E720FBD|nr:hypothetical protein [Streptococcus respiraculi]
MFDSKEVCQKLGISERTLTTWRTKIVQISGRKFKMEANPRGYSHYLYSDRDLERFQELSQKIRKTGDIDNSVRKVFGDRYKEMIEEHIEFVGYDIENIQEQLKSLTDNHNKLLKLYNDDKQRLEARITQLEEAFETEQGKGALERLGFKKAK